MKFLTNVAFPKSHKVLNKILYFVVKVSFIVLICAICTQRERKCIENIFTLKMTKTKCFGECITDLGLERNPFEKNEEKVVVAFNGAAAVVEDLVV